MTAAARPCWPDFSPATLALFLRARRLAHEDFGRQGSFADWLMDASGLAWSDIRRAFAGRLADPGKRAALWAAIGHYPGDHGIVLSDEGGQFFASRLATAAAPPEPPTGRGISRDARSRLRPSPETDGGLHG